MHKRLDTLGRSLRIRYERLGDLSDLNRSISANEDAVRLTPEGHPDKSHHLEVLGNLLFTRSERAGDLADLDRSILVMEDAVRLTPRDHPERSNRLINLTKSYWTRYDRQENLADLTMSIFAQEASVQLTPDDHPDKPERLSILGHLLLTRFQKVGNLEDLHKSVLMKEEAVRLSPEGHVGRPICQIYLAISLSARFKQLGDAADMDKAILMQEDALQHTPDDYHDRPKLLHDLGEMYYNRFEKLENPADIHASISAMEDAVRLTSDDHLFKLAYLYSLCLSLWARFNRLGDIADVGRVISVEEETVRLIPEDHADKHRNLSSLSASFRVRFLQLGDLADLDRSISAQERAAQLTPDDHSQKPDRLAVLGGLLCARFEKLGNVADIDRAVSVREDAERLTPDDHSDKPQRLAELSIPLTLRFERSGNVADIDRAISLQEDAVRRLPDGDPHKPEGNLASPLLQRFRRQGDLADIENSVSVLEDAVQLTPDGHPDNVANGDKPARVTNVGSLFLGCPTDLGDSAALDRAISHFSSTARSFGRSSSTRLRASVQWAESARLRNSDCLLDAYTTAVDPVPQAAWLGLPLKDRHHELLRAADVVRGAAAAALDRGHRGLAVEWLEQGRAVVWNLLLQLLRTPLDELEIDHPALASGLCQVSNELERGSRHDIAGSMENDETASPEAQARRHRALASANTRSVSPTFGLCLVSDAFLLPKTLSQLASSAHSGPVVILDASRLRCDTLILRAESDDVPRVPLAAITYEEVEKLQKSMNQPLAAHGHVISRTDRAVEFAPMKQTPDQRFQSILARLWEKDAKPGLDALGFLTPGTGHPSRIFWCPTGPFSFLPIHSAGLYDAADPGSKLSDFVISSYTPTLSVLAQPPPPHDGISANTLRLVAVPQPKSDGQGRLHGPQREVDYIKATLESLPPTPVSLAVSNGTVEDVLEKMKESDWIHFACHGVQDIHSPLESGLMLADGRRLKLTDINQFVRRRGGLASLSACQTAMGDKTLPEEAVHLAAGMLLAGYGGVIATIWSIRDADAPEVAKSVYEQLFRDGDSPDCRQVARALHYAVENLRQQDDISFVSWVPFIHVGLFAIALPS
ncbi:uncharacterized protein FIBRA_01068 [Fibroporia radiculosa]|uniref:CHAT domain-containing protein n=1 Tax=Fibroporia radiculosa TaxID=599839 RepID=J4HSQ0_9APHY|nr:uncharacterized protein FIBRA_01068 [Fibroporia radiculosa]CCL99057.1 predicted protein [Fibroporia radiculosa]